MLIGQGWPLLNKMDGNIHHHVASTLCPIFHGPNGNPCANMLPLLLSHILAKGGIPSYNFLCQRPAWCTYSVGVIPTNVLTRLSRGEQRSSPQLVIASIGRGLLYPCIIRDLLFGMIMEGGAYLQGAQTIRLSGLDFVCIWSGQTPSRLLYLCGVG